MAVSGRGSRDMKRRQLEATQEEVKEAIQEVEEADTADEIIVAE